MASNMSFAMTIGQFNRGEKDVTRRFGWWKLKPGDRIWAVEKSMGIPKGEKIKRLDLIEIVSVRQEPLNKITKEDCIREGFPHFAPWEFVAMLTTHYKCDPNSICNRIEFKRLHVGQDFNEQGDLLK